MPPRLMAKFHPNLASRYFSSTSALRGRPESRASVRSVAQRHRSVREIANRACIDQAQRPGWKPATQADIAATLGSKPQRMPPPQMAACKLQIILAGPKARLPCLPATVVYGYGSAAH